MILQIASYSINATKGGKLPKEIAQTLAETLSRNIWAKVHFNEKKGLLQR
jgi:hypothetical protein